MKPLSKQPNIEARVNSQPEEGDIMKKEGETPREPKWETNRGNLTVTHQAIGGKCKEPG